MKLGRKIFYDNVTGLPIVDTGQWDNAIRSKTVDEEIASYPALSERNRNSFDVIALPYGAYQLDFVTRGYRVNVETQELEFINSDELTDEPVYEKALGLQVKELQERNKNPEEKYNEIDIETVTIEELKIAKTEALNYLCEQDIMNGFTSTLNDHVYRTNRDDQTNFLGKFNQLMNDETIVSVFWKTEDVGYLEHTREDWLSIYYEALTTKEIKLFKYNQLKQAVDSKTTNADVDAVVWYEV